jgi:peroxiredoxin-like protein
VTAQLEFSVTAFPHHYSIAARSSADGDVALEGDRLPTIVSAPPTEFGGPGDRWSPETLLVAAVADCFILTFRAIASVSKFSWSSLACDVTGTVDRVDRITQFTEIKLRARLRVPSGGKEEQAMRLLTKAEETCLVTNSLKIRPHLEAIVETEPA